jgi:FHA domain
VTGSKTSIAPGSAFILRCVRGKLANTDFAFQERAVVGRLPGLDLCIDDPSVSRRHAQIELVAGVVFVLDLSSANGTRINRRLIRGRARLRPGDRLQFGADDSVFELFGLDRRPRLRRAVPFAAGALVLAIPITFLAISRIVSHPPPVAGNEGHGLPASQTPPPPWCAQRRVADQECASLPGKEADSAIQAADEPEPLMPDLAERPSSGRAEVRAAFVSDLEQQNTTAEMAEALASYWEGRLSDARARLKKLTAQAESNNEQERLKAIAEDFSSAERLFKRGEGLLAARAPELAREPFLRVLEHDRRLLEGLGDRYPSLYRRKIQEDMARNCYAKGRQWLERRNQRKACRVWKLGFEFYKGNADLNKAVASCSRRGAEALREVRGCEQLLEVLDFAVDGDGIAPKIDEMRTALRCRS